MQTAQDGCAPLQALASILLRGAHLMAHLMALMAEGLQVEDTAPASSSPSPAAVRRAAVAAARQERSLRRQQQRTRGHARRGKGGGSGGGFGQGRGGLRVMWAHS